MSYPFDKPSGIQKLKNKNFFKNGIVNNFKETFDSLSMNDQEWKINIKSNINKGNFMKQEQFFNIFSYARETIKNKFCILNDIVSELKI